MNETALLWLLGILITVVIGLAIAIFNHVRECREPRSQLATLESEVNRIKEDIGTHDSGMRGHIHQIANDVSQVAVNVNNLMWHTGYNKRDER